MRAGNSAKESRCPGLARTAKLTPFLHRLTVTSPQARRSPPLRNGLTLMPQTKRVLIVSTMFPPVASVGARRVVGFVKYLPEYGWEPYVLTIRPGPYHALGPQSELPRNLPPDRVARTSHFDLRLAGKKLLLTATGKGVPHAGAEVAQAVAMAERPGNFLWRLANSLIFVPDSEIGWFPFAAPAGVSLIRRHRIDVILSSAPPFTAHLIARQIKHPTCRPWLADFRDPWSQTIYNIVSRWHGVRRPIDQFLERKVMKSADAVLTVSRPIADKFSKLRVKGLERKLHVVTNGYDPDEFAGLVHKPPERFTVTYTGSFYGAALSPEPFFTTLADLLEAGQLRRDRLRVRILERFAQNTSRLAAQHGLSDVVVVQAEVPHRETIQEQIDASLLLLIVGSGSDKKGVYTAKLFEYLAAKRPILALAPQEGVAASLIRQANAGIVVDPANRREIKKAILRYYSEHERTGSVRYHGRGEVVRRYEQPVLAGRLAKVLDSVTTP